jgi:hypothetical protein
MILQASWQRSWLTSCSLQRACSGQQTRPNQLQLLYQRAKGPVAFWVWNTLQHGSSWLRSMLA